MRTRPDFLVRFFVQLGLMCWACHLFYDWSTFWAVFLMILGNNAGLTITSERVYVRGDHAID